MTKVNSPACAFCGNEKSDVAAMTPVGSSGVFICRHCLGSTAKQQPTATAVACSVCGTCHYHLRQSTHPTGCNICEQCVQRLSAENGKHSPPSIADLTCSFCQKEGNRVEKLFASQSQVSSKSYICNECIAKFAQSSN